MAATLAVALTALLKQLCLFMGVRDSEIAWCRVCCTASGSDVVSLSKGNNCAVARGQVVVTCVCNSYASQNVVQLYSGLPWANILTVTLSSCGVQVIPHNFGRQRPPIIASHNMVEDKIRMCDVLSDIEVAQDLLESKPEEEEEQVELPHPADEKYTTLQADLDVIQSTEEEYKIVQKFAEV